MAETDTKRLSWPPGLLAGPTSAASVSTAGASARPWRFILLWSLSWGAVGLVVGPLIVLAQQSLAREPVALSELVGPITRLSILFAEVVGLTALISSRVIFPHYASLPYVPRLMLQAATVGGSALLGTVAVVFIYPFYSLYNLRLIAVMIVVNATLALVVGIAVETYESMKLQIEMSYADLRKKEALEREVEIAREVQEQLFPRTVPRVRGLEIAGICLPAAGVGGDYYDYLHIAEDRLGLVVADVCGKGISAALLMASLQAAARNVIGPETTPREANRRLNEMLYASTSASRYATLFLCMFDGRERLLRYSNAGHNPPLILRRGAVERLTEGGLPLGVLGGVEYGEGEHRLELGDLLLLYTDGAVEASDPSGREYGLDRLARFLSQRQNGQPLGDLIGLALADLRLWTQASPQQDDITLVLARTVA